MRTVQLEREVKIVNSESTVRRVHLRAPAAESPLRTMLRAHVAKDNWLVSCSARRVAGKDRKQPSVRFTCSGSCAVLPV